MRREWIRCDRELKNNLYPKCDSNNVTLHLEMRRLFRIREYFGPAAKRYRHDTIATSRTRNSYHIHGWPITVIRLLLSPPGSLEMSGGPPTRCYRPFVFVADLAYTERFASSFRVSEFKYICAEIPSRFTNLAHTTITHIYHLYTRNTRASACIIIKAQLRW